MSPSIRARHAARGFSMVELLVTVVLAGIIFAAMVPMFASALKKTTGDHFRVTATNIAQDRLEKVRQLNYTDITLAHLNDGSFASGQFATSYTPPASNKTYTISYAVSPTPSASPQVNYKKVSVTVTWPGSGPNYTTTMNTIVMDPTSASVTSLSNPNLGGPWKLTVAFKNWSQVTKASGAGGVSFVQVYCRPGTPTPVPTQTGTVSTTLWPASAATPTVTWTLLPGGPLIIYRVTCRSTKFTSTAPDFHLLNNGWMKFDTNPGGS